MVRITMLAVAIVTLAAPGARGQDPDQVTKLKREVELLKKEIELLKKENALLTKEVETLKKEKGDPSAADKGAARPNPTAKLNGVDYELLQCTRDPKKRTMVSFTLGIKSEERDMTLHFVPHQLSLTDGDGAAIDFKMVKGLPLTASPLGERRAQVNLPKGQVIKLQIVVDGVKEGLTTIDRVELTAPPRGVVVDKVTFTGVKVATKK